MYYVKRWYRTKEWMHIKITFIYILMQMRLKFILPSNNEKVSDCDVLRTKTSQIASFWQIHTRCGSEAEFTQNNIMQRLPNIWDELPKENCWSKKHQCASLKVRRKSTCVWFKWKMWRRVKYTVRRTGTLPSKCEPEVNSLSLWKPKDNNIFCALLKYD